MIEPHSYNLQWTWEKKSQLKNKEIDKKSKKENKQTIYRCINKSVFK